MSHEVSHEAQPTNGRPDIDINNPDELLTRQYLLLDHGRAQFLKHLRRSHPQSTGGTTCHTCIHLRHKILFIEGLIRDIQFDSELTSLLL